MSNYHYFEGADPTDLTKMESDYMKQLHQQRMNSSNHVQNTVYVSPKIDGHRAILYHKIRLETSKGTKQVVYDTESYHMITRRGERHEVKPTWIPASLASMPFIFDIEIVKGAFYNRYFIMDVLHLGEEELQNTNFEYRLQKLNTLDLHEGAVGEGRGVEFLKVPYEIYNPDKVVSDITKLTDAHTDGVVFCFGKDWVRQSRKRFKLEDTIDFQILPMDSKKKVGLGVLVSSQHPMVGPSRIMNRRNMRKNRRYPQRVEIFAPYGAPEVHPSREGTFEMNAIYEFRYDGANRKFECVRRRHDKVKPNKLFVANFIFREIIKKKHLINPFRITRTQNEEEEEKDSSQEDPSSNPLSM
jgi:hypothetical protein